MPNQNSNAGHKPQRTCVVCKTTREMNSLWSFILLPEGLIFDPRRVIQMRKMYVCSAAVCLEGLDKWKKAYLKKRFGINSGAAVFTQKEHNLVPGKK